MGWDGGGGGEGFEAYQIYSLHNFCGMTERDVSYGVLLGVASLLAWQYLSCWRAKEKFEEAYWGERRGRARVEKEMRKISNIRLDTSQGFYVQPIGEISSCYRQCVGTPRQGLLVPASRASIKLTPNVSSEAIEGLQEFSHVWITFKFHLNTNTLKESKAFSKRSTFNGKITLPMLKKKLGVFATRSPHRPNPVGVTLAQVRGIDKKKHVIYLNGCDLVQGTPVLDIKPYVPAYDTASPFRIPQWIEETVFTRNEVVILPTVVERVEKIQSRLKQFHNDAPEYLNALRETLEAEVRSKFQTNKQMEFTAKGLPVCVLFDETIVKYHWLSERKFEVVEVCLVSEDRELVKELMKAQLEGNEEEGAGEECGEEEGLNDQGLPKSAGTEGSQALSEPSLSLISDHANERSIYEVDLSQFCRPPAAAK